MLLILGALIVLGSVGGGYLMHGGHLLVLNQPSEFIMIGGAAIGSLLIGTPPRVVRQLVGQIGGSFAGRLRKADYEHVLTMLYQLFKVIQQSGVMALEEHFDDPSKSSILSKFPGFLRRTRAVRFLSDSVKVIMMGSVAPHDLEALLEQDLDVHHREALQPAETMAKIADALPGLGIVAAVLGVVITMQAIDGPPEEIGHKVGAALVGTFLGIKVGAALVGTFLGILLSYGFAQPLATNLEHRVAEELCYVECIKAGLLGAYKGLPPVVALEFARRSLPDAVRPSFEEVEAASKPAAATEDAKAA